MSSKKRLKKIREERDLTHAKLGVVGRIHYITFCGACTNMSGRWNTCLVYIWDGLKLRITRKYQLSLTRDK